MAEQTIEQQWQEICTALKNTSNDPILQWLVQVSPSIQNDTLVLSASNRFICNWLQSKTYDSQILQMFKQKNPSLQAIDVKLQDYVLPPKKAESPAPQALAEPVQSQRKIEDIVEIHLNPAMTFENYVVGSSNELACAAAKGVTEHFDATRNPLFLHSSVGLGKTHLMNAIAWRMREKHPEKKVLYMSAEQFMYQYVRALRSDKNSDDKIADFREVCRSADVLMIDDVQFICGKQGTQTEFFHTFNALVEQGKQIVLSSDSSPLELKGLEDRLKTRMAQGLIVDIYPTTFEMRIGILQSKAEQWHVSIPNDVAEFLAERITTNVRELEGALKRLVANTQLLGSPITMENTQRILKDVLQLYKQEVTVDDILKKVSEYFGVRMADLQSARRDRSIARPRQVAMYLAKELTSKSLPEIGTAFGRDHTTILHAVRVIEGLVKTDPDIANAVRDISRSFNK